MTHQFYNCFVYDASRRYWYYFTTMKFHYLSLYERCRIIGSEPLVLWLDFYFICIFLYVYVAADGQLLINSCGEVWLTKTVLNWLPKPSSDRVQLMMSLVMYMFVYICIILVLMRFVLLIHSTGRPVARDVSCDMVA